MAIGGAIACAFWRGNDPCAHIPGSAPATGLIVLLFCHVRSARSVPTHPPPGPRPLPGAPTPHPPWTRPQRVRRRALLVRQPVRQRQGMRQPPEVLPHLLRLRLPRHCLHSRGLLIKEVCRNKYTFTCHPSCSLSLFEESVRRNELFWLKCSSKCY